MLMNMSVAKQVVQAALDHLSQLQRLHKFKRNISIRKHLAGQDRRATTDTAMSATGERLGILYQAGHSSLLDS